MEQINFAVAFVAGLVSFLSPCVLPLVPGYISLISGVSFQELSGPTDRHLVLRKAVVSALMFVVGFSIVFTLLGAFASGLGSPLAGHMPLLKRAAGLLIVLFGLHVMGVLPIKWLYYQKSASLSRFKPGTMGALLMGMAFAFGWTPCVGPILASLLTLSVTEGSLTKGMSLLFIYSMGIGIPFILTAFGVGRFLKFFEKYRRFIRWGEVAAGLLLMGVGILIFIDRFSELTRFFPFLNRFVL
ncbi:MAG: cytochrome c biogenesis protein CcdA [Elusimicrobia bacterium]|nr:cytochrome c biogenesis protein CcdA [Elusimicrobiota bacterium]